MAISWQNLGDLPGAFNYSNLMALDGVLYSVRNNGGGTESGTLVSWDGAAWSVVGIGPGVDVGTYFLGAVAGDIYATTYNCAKWNGSSWDSLGMQAAYPGLLAMTIPVDHGGEAHFFLNASGDPINSPSGRVIKWNGSAWSNVTGLLPIYSDCMIDLGGVLYVLDHNDGKLYALGGGTLTAVTGAAWNGGDSQSGYYGNLLVFGGEIYMSRCSDAEDPLQLGNLFKWNGSSAWNIIVPWAFPPASARFLFLAAAGLYSLEHSGGASYAYPDLDSNGPGPADPGVDIWTGTAALVADRYAIGLTSSFSRSTLFKFDSGEAVGNSGIWAFGGM